MSRISTPPRYRLPKGLYLLDACFQGKAALSNHGAFVDAWYPDSVANSHRALGLTMYGFQLFLQYSDCILEEALICRRSGVCFDDVWKRDRVSALVELCQEIMAVKAELHHQTFLSNADTSEKLDALGELIARKNGITGLAESLEYLYLNDYEFFCCVAGFLGEELRVVDSKGVPLLVGDTVVFSDNSSERMVFRMVSRKPIFEQQDLLVRGAVKKTTCWSYDLATAQNMVFQVTKHSCLERYLCCHPAEVPEPEGMTMGQ